MTTILTDGAWLSLLLFGVLLVGVFHRPLKWVAKVLGRSAVGLGFLALWSHSGLAAGLSLGVNAFNGLVLGLLGIPGLGLLLLLKWVGT